jgi:hypothetical protein
VWKRLRGRKSGFTSDRAEEKIIDDMKVTVALVE